jgi:NTE family protein
MSLGAYGAGAFDFLTDAGHQVRWVAGSSIGAVNAALVAGSQPQARVDHLRRFWSLIQPHPDDNGSVQARKARSWASVLRSRLDGAPGHFVPRIFQSSGGFVSSYDLGPMAVTLANLIDFDLLNEGSVRFSLLTTDLATGEPIAFDTGRGDRIEMSHILASCGLPPEFPAVRIRNRTLGDGGLTANAPLCVVADELEDGDLCIVIDNFSNQGALPDSLESASARKSELIFASQTTTQLAMIRETARLKRTISQLAETSRGRNAKLPREARAIDPAEPAILAIAYRPEPWEAGPELIFDYSPRTIFDRWQAGRRDMERVLQSHRMAADFHIALDAR